MNTLPKILNIMPSIKGLNLWTLKQKIKNRTIQRTPTMQLLQCIDIYTFKSKTSIIDAKMLVLIDNFKPLHNPNLKFKSDSRQNAQRYLERYSKKRTTGFMKSHSFVLQFLQRLEGEFAGQWRGYSDAVSMVDITNTSRSLTNVQWHCYSLDHDWCIGMEAASGDDGYGIVVGTGTSAPTNADYVLQTKIAHGNAAGQLQYASTSVGGAGINGANVDMIISRMFVNGSGGTITLKEIGVYVKSAGPSVYTFLFMRDAVNQTINNGEVALVSYDMRTTV